MAAVRPGLLLKKQAEEARIEAARLRTEYEAATKLAASFSDAKLRTQVREQSRRAEIVGNLFLFLCNDNPTMWTDFAPHLDRMMETARDTDRALFGLPALHPAKPASTAKISEKKPTDPGKSSDGKGTSQPPAPADQKPPLPPIPAEKKSGNSVAD